MDFDSITVKYVSLTFNLLCAPLSVAFIAIGAVLAITLSIFREFANNNLIMNIPFLIIGMGCLIIFVAFFGCCGALKSSNCMLTSYSVCLFFLMLLQIVAVTLIVITRANLSGFFSTAFVGLWKDVRRKHNEGKRALLDSLQEDFKCCGIDGPKNYQTIPLEIPISCCIDKACENGYYLIGCKGVVSDSVLSIFNSMAYIGMGTIFIELVGFLAACCLVYQIRIKKQPV